MKLIQSILVMFLTGILLACGGSNNSSNNATPPQQPEEVILFTDLVLEDTVFIQFTFDDSVKLAATNKGIYRLANSQWTLLSDDEWYVYDIAIISATHHIASIQHNNSYHLVESVNSGTSWDFVTNDFGGPDRDMFGGNEKMNRIKYEASSGILYATGYDVLATSSDFGRSWLAVSGVWQGLARGLSALAINTGQATIWFGGQGAIENPICREYSISNNDTTSHDDSISNLLPLPSTVDNIVIHPSETNTVFAMGEGGIVVSRNGGDDWAGFILDGNYRFYYNLIIDPDNSDRMYTAGWSKEIKTPQDLIIERTLNGGATWQNYVHPSDTLYGGVRAIAHSYNQNNQLVLHFALQNGGVIDARFTN